jgi:Zn-dependent protease
VLGVVVAVVLLHTHRITQFDVVLFLVLIPSIVLHEVSHGYVAWIFGDDTAKRAGRLTLNPIPHIDPFGSIILPALLVLSGAGAFGWARPVPVNLARLRHPRNQAVLVSLAGPATNIAIAVVCGLAFGLATPVTVRNELALLGFNAVSLRYQILFMAGYANVILAVFNLLPIPPLDGSALLERIMPRSWIPGYLRLRPFTIVVPLLIVMVYPAVLDKIFQPALDLWAHLLG